MYQQRLARFNRSKQWNACTDSMLEKAWRFMPTGREVQMVDIGCGVGTFCKKVRLWYPRVGVIGTECQEESIEFLKAAHPDIAFLQQPSEQMPVGEWSTDWITCIHVISHVQYPTKLVYNAHRVLKPGGWASFVVPNLWFDLAMVPVNLVTGYKGDPTIRHHWTPKQFERLLLRECFVEVFTEMLGEYAVGWDGKERMKAWFICHARKRML